MNTSLPTFLFSSPAGIHISELHEFLRSNFKASVSEYPARAKWLLKPNSDQIYQDTASYGPASAEREAVWAAKLCLYNNSRGIDRIRAVCMRRYRVGEPLKQRDTMEEFLNHP